MSDDLSDLEPIELGPGDLGPGHVAPGDGGAGWPRGWYADPWSAGQYRFWNGEAWTTETHNSGPAVAQSGYSQSAYSQSYSQPAYSRSEYTPSAYPLSPNPRGRRTSAIVAGLVVLVLLAGAIGYEIESHVGSNDSASVAPAPSPSPSTTAPGVAGGSTGTAAERAALARIVVQQADVGRRAVVLLIPGGNRTTQPTLDLCNGRFASEGLRVARLQVDELDATGNSHLSTEAVVYRDPAATSSTFAELRSVSADCPHTPVVSPVQEPTAVTKFNAAPDRGWPSLKSVDRQAYSFTTTEAGTTGTSIAVYLRHGRVLLGLYFPNPTGAQPAVAGKTTIESIVALFESRLAALPASVVNGSS